MKNSLAYRNLPARGPEALTALATEGQAYKVGVSRMSIYPRDVIRMDREKTLSSVIKAGWRKTTGEDPVAAARKSVHARRKRVMWGLFLIASAVLGFFAYPLIPT